MYRTGEHLRYCKEFGIPIEGIFGVAKRTYTIDRVRTKLAETNETTIAMVKLGEIMWSC